MKKLFLLSTLSIFEKEGHGSLDSRQVRAQTVSLNLKQNDWFDEEVTDVSGAGGDAEGAPGFLSASADPKFEKTYEKHLILNTQKLNGSNMNELSEMVGARFLQDEAADGTDPAEGAVDVKGDDGINEAIVNIVTNSEVADAEC